MSDEQMRAEFEAWAKAHFVEPNLKRYPLGFPRYCEDETQIAYEAFHAGMQAARAQPPSAGVPEGWKMVPVEPTPEMLMRGTWSGNGDVGVDEEWARKVVYQRMLAASPEPPEE